MNLEQRFLSLHDFEGAARARLPRGLFGFVHGGSADGWSVASNRAAYDRWAFVPRTLNAPPARSQRVSLFGQAFSSPIGIAPVGVSALFAFDADVATARAAARADVPYVLSGASLTPMERILEAHPKAWFQAYVDADRARTGRLLARLQRTSCQVLVLTVDTPVAPSRELSMRHGFSIPVRPGPRFIADVLRHPRWLVGTWLRTWATGGVPRMENMDEGALHKVTEAPRGAPAAALTWDDFAWIRRQWDRALVVKGVVHPGDAVRYRQAGADGLLVSNHGGRQLDGTLPTLDALPAIGDAVRGLPLLLDGGIRRGSDVVKGLALGATSTLAGRPMLYAVASAGEAGVGRAIEILKAEIDRTQALMGVPEIAGLGREHVVPALQPLQPQQPPAQDGLPDVPALARVA